MYEHHDEGVVEEPREILGLGSRYGFFCFYLVDAEKFDDPWTEGDENEGGDGVDAESKVENVHDESGSEADGVLRRLGKCDAEVFVSPSEGGQLIVKTVIFKVIQIDGKIRVKDIINVIDNGGKATSAGPNEEVMSDDEDDLDSPLSEEHD